MSDRVCCKGTVGCRGLAENHACYVLSECQAYEVHKVQCTRKENHDGNCLYDKKGVVCPPQDAYSIGYENARRRYESKQAIPMILECPKCGYRHIDEGEFATKVHHTHACQTCGHCWRPAIVCTVGVQFLPGFKNG